MLSAAYWLLNYIATAVNSAFCSLPGVVPPIKNKPLQMGLYAGIVISTNIFVITGLEYLWSEHHGNDL
jgi:hypothetical protein